MQAEKRRTEIIDLERAIYDPEYRRSVIDSLRIQYRASLADKASDPASPSGERKGPDRPRRGALSQD